MHTSVSGQTYAYIASVSGQTYAYIGKWLNFYAYIGISDQTNANPKIIKGKNVGHSGEWPTQTYAV